LGTCLGGLPPKVCRGSARGGMNEICDLARDNSRHYAAPAQGAYRVHLALCIGGVLPELACGQSQLNESRPRKVFPRRHGSEDVRHTPTQGHNGILGWFAAAGGPPSAPPGASITRGPDHSRAGGWAHRPDATVSRRCSTLNKPYTKLEPERHGPNRWRRAPKIDSWVALHGQAPTQKRHQEGPDTVPPPMHARDMTTAQSLTA
jgi:hypothetical protein